MVTRLRPILPARALKLETAGEGDESAPRQDNARGQTYLPPRDLKRGRAFLAPIPHPHRLQREIESRRRDGRQGDRAEELGENGGAGVEDRQGGLPAFKPQRESGISHSARQGDDHVGPRITRIMDEQGRGRNHRQRQDSGQPAVQPVDKPREENQSAKPCDKRNQVDADFVKGQGFQDDTVDNGQGNTIVGLLKPRDDGPEWTEGRGDAVPFVVPDNLAAQSEQAQTDPGRDHKGYGQPSPEIALAFPSHSRFISARPLLDRQISVGSETATDSGKSLVQ